jgi:hypothetical protein
MFHRFIFSEFQTKYDNPLSPRIHIFFTGSILLPTLGSTEFTSAGPGVTSVLYIETGKNRSTRKLEEYTDYSRIFHILHTALVDY